jgi:hypothetical protein
MRSVRATDPTNSEPPENRAMGVDPSRSRYERCSGVCPGGGQRPQGQPAEVDLLPIVESLVLEDALPGSGGQDLGAYGGELSAA